MKEPVTKFDLEAAFKALDEIEAPKTKGIRANTVYLNEAVRKTPNTEALLEDYYNVNNQADLDDAREEREAEVAKAKLARIEKIVDLNADSEEDLLPSYVGKVIVQCPQCMTLFYKDAQDIEKAEDDETTCNVGEVCQHCGNADGYTIIGKVDNITPEEADKFEADDIPAEGEEEGAGEEAPADLNLEAPEEAPAEEKPAEEEGEAEGEEPELSLEDLPEEPSEEDEEDKEKKKKEESLETDGAVLTESKEFDDKMKEFNDYVEYLNKAIEQEEAELANANNDLVKEAIQRKIDALKADLDAALPEVVKNETPSEGEEPEALELENEATEEEPAKEDKEEKVEESLTESAWLKEAPGKDVTDDAAFDNLLKSKEFKTPISDTEVEGYLSKMSNESLEEECEDCEDCECKNCFEDVEDIDEESINECITKSLTDVYENVNSFKTTECKLAGNKLIIEGLITFKSGKTKPTKYTFNHVVESATKTIKCAGINESLTDNGLFVLSGRINESTKSFTATKFKYKYNVENNLVEGLIRR